jgi:hypothetical protein
MIGRFLLVLWLLPLAACAVADRPDWLNRANAAMEERMNQYPGGGIGYGVDAAVAGEQIRALRR